MTTLMDYWYELFAIKGTSTTSGGVLATQHDALRAHSWYEMSYIYFVSTDPIQRSIYTWMKF